jgi:diaminohydroxyphosphoribosylaminopyrimidine deaminase / 5-amino-6-(5-phosphoribosylamino)uracil reductase
LPVFSHEDFMRRCLELAQMGKGNVAPNPMVGAVIVHEGKIIGEGYHQQYGGPHAEVNAIRSVDDQSLLSQSTLYVSLEPCVHTGKTPPCADLVIEKQIPYVVIACLDENPLVKGKGVQKLITAGTDVKLGVLEKEALYLNRRFFAYHEKHRPYVILKWAQSADGFMDHVREENDGKRAIISSPESLQLVHEWRATETAILVGTNTVLQDDPQLTVRLVEGRNPVRVTFDRSMRIPSEAKIFDGSSPTIVFNSGAHYYTDKAEFIPIDFADEPLKQALKYLHHKKLNSVLVEGGAAILNEFFKSGLWDEAQVFVSPNKLNNGIKAPIIDLPFSSETNSGKDQLFRYENPLPKSC